MIYIELKRFIDLTLFQSVYTELLAAQLQPLFVSTYTHFDSVNLRAPIHLPRPLSNDPRFIQCIYRYCHASKRFVEVY